MNRTFMLKEIKIDFDDDTISFITNDRELNKEFSDIPLELIDDYDIEIGNKVPSFSSIKKSYEAEDIVKTYNLKIRYTQPLPCLLKDSKGFICKVDLRG